MTGSRLRIIVAGMAAQYPLGGVAWDYLQYVIGLHELGHEVYYYEDSWSWPFHPVENRNTDDGSYSAQYLKGFFDRYAPELSGNWHYWHLQKDSFGMAHEKFKEIARTADIFLNVSGACFIPDNLPPRCLKVFLDSDPGYNQIVLSEQFEWAGNVKRWSDAVAAHDRHFTYAENIDGPDCLIPKAGYDWKTTRMPVVLKLWESLPPLGPDTQGPWTTIMTWNAFRGKLIYKGVEYGSKGREFEKLIDLPGLTRVQLKIGLGGIDAPIERLKARGWLVVDAPKATITPQAYQDFIRASRGELSVAKNVYVAMRSGWFSCRSACYLAAGRPVVVQDTGFSGIIPPAKGLFAFSDAEEAASAIETIEQDYGAHQKGAREAAREHFCAKKVLGDMLKKLD